MPRKYASRKADSAPRFASRLVGKPTAALFGLLVAVFGAGYLMQVNAASSKGYEIRALERRISELKEETERVELKVAQEQSVQAVEAKVREMGMVPTPKLDYLTVAAAQVARN